VSAADGSVGPDGVHPDGAVPATPVPPDRRPTLLILSFSPLVDDARVMKQIRLFTPDYDVTTCGHGPAPEGVVRHVRIPDHLKGWRLDRAALVLRRFRRAQATQEVVTWVRQHLTGGPWDVVLADDVETVPLALSLAPAGGVHADLHEFASRQKEDVPRWRLFVAPYVRWLIRTYVTRAASVTTVGAGLARQYEKEFGLTVDVVTNAAPYRDLAPTPVERPLRLVHSGAAMPDRHLEIMIDAMAAITRPARLDLYLTRNNPDYVEQLRARAAAVGPDRVRVLDPVPYSALPDTLARYDVGVFSLPPVSFNYTWTLPNKLFDFVQARLAVVVSPSPEMRAVVAEHGLGVVTEDFTAESLAAALDDLSDEDVARGKRASHRAARELSAENQSEPWKRAVDELARRAADPMTRRSA
jgi:glycosyltransferase involved in cell wall biosynthesis